MDLKDKNVVIIGAGDIAYRKVEVLLPFHPKITVIAKKVNEKIKELFFSKKIDLKIKQFDENDIQQDHFLVVVAVDDLELQKRISQICSKKNILVNSVDSKEYCSFIFGSIIHDGDLVIGINTSSKAPAVSKALKAYLMQRLPKNIENLIEKVSKLRKIDTKNMQIEIKKFFNDAKN
ncbi:precorrin-2 dehydrogenase/sirohydrochlorin ferrochelatase family protein [Desulfurella amilsii]|uniref:precorrin-2 dehydrogenase/sirohydrochlorin ferrochelatase family protein n=1 Tax=Desulfurella amilsii TaxID=1562698 RepID=UPI0038FC0704